MLHNAFIPPFVRSRGRLLEGSRRTTLVLTVATIVATAAVATVLGLGVLYGAQGASTTSTALPSYCVRPAGGFLIVVSRYGYNDSILEGAGPSKPWPIVEVAQGQTVDIGVCNIDSEAHGFQISDYVQSSVNVVPPGGELHFTFVADKEGTFGIYCAIPCDLHPELQYGQLRVAD